MQRGAFSLRTVHHFWSDPCSSLSAGFIFISFCRIHVHLFLPDSACTFERSGSPRVLAPKNNAQYPIFVQKMPETGNRCYFYLLIPNIFKISGYQKAKYSCNTRRQEIPELPPTHDRNFRHFHQPMTGTSGIAKGYWQFSSANTLSSTFSDRSRRLATPDLAPPVSSYVSGKALISSVNSYASGSIKPYVPAFLLYTTFT